MPQIAVHTIKAQIASVLTAWGMPADHVATTADLMVEADIRGIDSHGIGMLPQYHDRRKDGRIIVPGEIKVVKDLPAMIFIDAGHALGHVPAKMAMQSAIAKAKDMGVGVGVVKDSNHFGAAGVYSTMALDAGLIGICMTGTAGVCTASIAGSTPCSNSQQLFVHLVRNLQNACAWFAMQLPVCRPRRGPKPRH